LRSSLELFALLHPYAWQINVIWEIAVEIPARTDHSILAEALPGVSWASIAAGAIAAVAVSLALLALGAGLGLSSISPWEGVGASASTFETAAGIYLVLVAVMSSAIGGYMAARMRTKWIGLHTNEVFFRDTAHGFFAWSFATLISATILGTATTHILGATAATSTGAVSGQAAQNTNPSQVYVDRLFRTDGTAASPTGAPASNENARAEVLRLWTANVSENTALSSTDRTYVARLVAAQTGMSQVDAERRVNDVLAEAKVAADRVRRGTTKFAFWMTASLLFGAFAASLAAVEGGQLRDGTWNERRLAPRPW
jgi:hypothetical protein